MAYFILTVIFSFMSIPAFALDSVGRIQNVKGDVRVISGERDTQANLDMPVYLNDQILTDAGEYVIITFADDSQITLTGMDGSLTIDRFVYDPETPTNNDAEFSILKASFEFTSGLISKTSQKGRINLDFGSIGIRGTHLYRSMKDMECWIFLKEGEIDVFNDAGQVSLKAGEGTRLAAMDKHPTPKALWSQDNIDWITQTTALPKN